MTAPSDQAYSEGRPITDLVLPAATGGNGALSYALAITSGSPALPPGLSFDAATRTLSGAPSGTQSATGYTYTATDADGDYATATFTITVAANSAPDLPSQAGLTYGTGRSVSHQLPAATGGNAPLSYALTKKDGTALPAWLSFAAATRTLSGTTPSSSSTGTEYTYTATDADGETDSTDFTITIESNSQPAVTAPSDQAYSKGRPITDLVLPAATGGNGALSYALAITSGSPALPPGLSFDAATRTLSGAPSGTQSATGYTYTATDADGDYATATFTITVAANSAPDLPSQAGLTYGTGRSVSHQLPAATGGNAPLSYALTKKDGTALPAWLSFAAATRTLSGTTPSSSSTGTEYTYTATDADGETDSTDFTITIESNSQPAVTAPSDQAYSKGRPITDLVLPAATGGNGALSYALAITSGSPALPPGLSFDAATRTLSGAPSGTQSATGYTYTATDADGDYATATFTITVAANSAPDLPSQAGLTYGTGRSVSHQLPAATGGNAPLSYALTKKDGTALPAWLSFAAATRTLSGTTPSSSSTGTEYTYTATDADGETDSTDFTITIESNSQPAVTAPSDQAYSKGRPITDLVLPAATGGNGALSYALAITSGSPALPPGLSFDAATRTLSGAPSGTQSATGYTYTATDADGDYATATFTITVAANSAPDLPSQAGLTYGTGRSVSHQLPAATGGNAPLSYALTKKDGTALPAWLSFAAATRTLSGTTPSSSSTGTEYTYTATDADGETDSTDFTITIESNSQPAVTAPSDQAYSEGRPITDLVLPAATGGNGALSYALAITSGSPALPPGLSFDAATRTLSGAPSGTQSATGYTYTATDADGDYATATFTITVAANSAPDLPSQAGLTYGTGRSVSHQLPAATGGNAPLSYALTKKDGTALPAWLSFAAATRTLSGTTPSSSSTGTEYTYTATDADGETDSTDFTITIESNSQPAVTAPSDQAYSKGRPITDLVLPAATGGNGALSYALAITSGSPALPPGLSFDAATRTLSGAPSGTQSATGYTYTATDADGDYATATFTITVAANSAPDLPSQAGLTYGTGRSVSHQLPAATGGNAPLSYALTKKDGTALPAWLSFAAATRTLSGTTPSSSSTGTEYTYTATDADGETDSTDFTITIESNSQPAVTAPSDQAYSEGRPITDLVLPAATGGNGALSYALAITSGSPALPPGLSFDAATRTLSGAPSGTQSATGYTYTATDADGDYATATFTITVAANSAPDLPSQAGLTYGTGRSVSHQLPAATGGNAPLSYALTKKDGTRAARLAVVRRRPPAPCPAPRRAAAAPAPSTPTPPPTPTARPTRRTSPSRSSPTASPP